MCMGTHARQGCAWSAFVCMGTCMCIGRHVWVIEHMCAWRHVFMWNTCTWHTCERCRDMPVECVCMWGHVCTWQGHVCVYGRDEPGARACMWGRAWNTCVCIWEHMLTCGGPCAWQGFAGSTCVYMKTCMYMWGICVHGRVMPGVCVSLHVGTHVCMWGQVSAWQGNAWSICSCVHGGTCTCYAGTHLEHVCTCGDVCA